MDHRVLVGDVKRDVCPKKRALAHRADIFFGVVLEGGSIAGDDLPDGPDATFVVGLQQDEDSAVSPTPALELLEGAV